MRVVLRIVLALFVIGSDVDAYARQPPPLFAEFPLNDPAPVRISVAEPDPLPAKPLPPAAPPDEVGMRATGGPIGGGMPGVDALWYPSQKLSGQDTKLGFVRMGVSAGMPVWQDGGDMLLATVSVKNTLFSTDAVLPDTGRTFPRELWNLNVGANSTHRFDNGWSGGLMLGFGSASDKPFRSIREVTGNIGAVLRVPVNDGRDAWQFLLMYSNGGPVPFPLPMVSYGWNPSDRLHVNVGLPLSLDWRPTDEWNVSLSYVPLYTVNARVTCHITPHLRVYAGYEYLNDSYFLADRADSTDRFFTFEQRLVAGVNWEFDRGWTLGVNGGYGFGRFFGEGDNQFGTLRDRIDVNPGPFLGLTVGVHF